MASVGSMLNNRYRLDRLIGAGGFAHVFLATDLELGRQVAIKILDQNWTRDKDLLTRFRNEARTIAALEHPNILLIYDYGIATGTPYLVMPYISGGTLADRMKEGPFTLDEIRFYLDQTGSALDYAHQHSVIHRDVKPSNLLIRADGQVVLMDFGLAKLLNNAAFAAQSVVLGTAAYLSPEQYQGIVTPASDIYMLGIILYEMLAGTLPYEGNMTRILEAHLHAAPPSLGDQPRMDSMAPAVVQALDLVIRKVLAKHPTERYQTCQALCRAYTQALDRAAWHKHDKHPDVRNLDKTLLTNQPLIVPLSTPSLSPQIPTSDHLEATLIAPHPSQRKKTLLKPPRLLVTTEPDKGFRATFDLTGETLTLGRARDNTLYIPLPIISRYHAVFTRLNDQSQEPSYKIVQRESINPLRFRGKKIAEKVLEHGDTIEIGDRAYTEYIVKLVYQAPEFG